MKRFNGEGRLLLAQAPRGRRPEIVAMRLAQGQVRRVMASRAAQPGRVAQRPGPGKIGAGDGGNFENDQDRHGRA